jgi:hypothetical protein
VVGKRGLKRKLLRNKRRRNIKFRNYDTMMILGVPDIVVRELVHVDLEPTVIIDVHVGNEELYDKPSFSLPT